MFIRLIKTKFNLFSVVVTLFSVTVQNIVPFTYNVLSICFYFISVFLRVFSRSYNLPIARMAAFLKFCETQHLNEFLLNFAKFREIPNKHFV